MLRISKLLAKEYREIDEPIIVESPFTQVTTNGLGIRQFQVALTASKILFACDDFDLVNVEDFGYHVQLPEIETLSLVGLLPLQALSIKFYFYNGRQIMRINKRSDEDQLLFLEIGGHLCKAFSWSTFWEQISCLNLMTSEGSKPIMNFEYDKQSVFEV